MRYTTGEMRRVINKQNILLWVIISLAFLFRTYKLDSYFFYGHEQDLQAFVIRDILIEHHPRLIGQETSIRGWFIGPLYYYLLAGSYVLFEMDPIGSLFPITLIAIATVVSVYWTTKKLYGARVGQIAALIYSVSMNIVILDRWAVPTQPTLLWTIWYWWVLVSLTRGKKNAYPVLIILLGLIWHIHVAFVPLLVLIPIALIMGGKKKFEFDKKLILSLIIFTILIAPLLVFEMRHGFSQIKSLTGLTYEDRNIAILSGWYKLEIILENTGRVLMQTIFYKLPENNFKISIIQWGVLVFSGILALIYKLKLLNYKELSLLIAWILVVITSLFGIQKALSEYYFNNLLIISLIAISLVVNRFRYKNLLLGGFLFLNIYYLYSWPVPKTEYIQKKAVVGFIGENVRKNNYDCVAINYIGNLGVEYGYRYLFDYYNINLISSGNDVPVYSIVNPYTISESEISFRADDLGVILPENRNYNPDVCDDSSRKLLPLNGFVD